MQPDCFQNRSARGLSEFVRRPGTVFKFNRGVVTSVNIGHGEADEGRRVNSGSEIVEGHGIGNIHRFCCMSTLIENRDRSDPFKIGMVVQKSVDAREGSNTLFSIILVDFPICALIA